MRSTYGYVCVCVCVSEMERGPWREVISSSSLQGQVEDHATCVTPWPQLCMLVWYTGHPQGVCAVLTLPRSQGRNQNPEPGERCTGDRGSRGKKEPGRVHEGLERLR